MEFYNYSKFCLLANYQKQHCFTCYFYFRRRRLPIKQYQILNFFLKLFSNISGPQALKIPITLSKINFPQDQFCDRAVRIYSLASSTDFGVSNKTFTILLLKISRADKQFSNPSKYCPQVQGWTPAKQ